MAIFANKDTKVLVQGITGNFGAKQTELMLEYGTKIIAGVTPGKGGQKQFDIPVYDSVRQAVANHDIDASLIFVPAPFVQDAAFEAIDAGIPFMVILTDWVPLHDELRVKAYAKRSNTRYIGPNCPGMIIPGETSLGLISGSAVTPGSVGIVSRSGTLIDEVAQQLTEQGIGQSIIIGIGGDPVVGTRTVEVLQLLREDKQTEVVLIVGEIGGVMEEEVAEYIGDKKFTKPVAAFIAGRTAPRGKRMGHAGAIVMGDRGTTESKIGAFSRVGVPVAKTLSEIPALLRGMI